MRHYTFCSISLFLVALVTIPPGSTREIDDAALIDESNTTEWLAHGRTQSEQRFSPLDQINASNVANLKLDWYLDLPDAVGLAATPLVADGVMYFTGSNNIVHAVDASNGRLIWKFDPRVEESAGERLKVSFLHGSRGVALWNDKVYSATRDGQLIALDATTGKEIWRSILPRRFTSQARPKYSKARC